MPEDLRMMFNDVNRAIAENDFFLTQRDNDLFEVVELNLANGWDLTEEQDEKFEALWKKAVGHGD